MRAYKYASFIDTVFLNGQQSAQNLLFTKRNGGVLPLSFFPRSIGKLEKKRRINIKKVSKTSLEYF
jgi:hypothetical protein